MSKLSNELIQAVHVVEEKYGDVGAAPAACPEILACHQIVSRMPKDEGPSVSEIDNQIRDLFNAGYQRRDIALMVGLSYSTVAVKLRQMNFIPQKSVYDFFVFGRYVATGTFEELAKIYHDVNPETLRHYQYQQPDRFKFVKVGVQHGSIAMEDQPVL